ncbi:hypothetical protein ACWGDX_24125 [Streptomyces sp. NPDC055025]
MRTTTAAIATALLLATLTACGSDSSPAPAETVTATATASPALSQAEITQQCIDAVAEVVSQRPADFDPETDTDPQPTECNGLSETDYLDAYMDGLSQSNQAAIEERERQRGEAAEADQP